MHINTVKALNNIKKVFKDWKLDYDWNTNDGGFTVGASITIRNHDDSVRLAIDAGYDGWCDFRAVFDKIDKTAEVLNLINTFNGYSPFFHAFIRDDGYLELSHSITCYGGEGVMKDHTEEYLRSISDLADNDVLLQLTARTHS